MVAAELRLQPYSPATQVLVVRNYGPSIARNVRVTFDPPIPDPADPASSVTPFLKDRYKDSLPVLTPGMELDNLYYVGIPGPGGQFVNSEPAPDAVTVTIEYESDSGDGYSDTFPLDTMLLRNRTYQTSSASPDALRKEMVSAVKGIQTILRDLLRRTPQ